MDTNPTEQEGFWPVLIEVSRHGAGIFLHEAAAGSRLEQLDSLVTHLVNAWGRMKNISSPDERGKIASSIVLWLAEAPVRDLKPHMPFMRELCAKGDYSESCTNASALPFFFARKGQTCSIDLEENPQALCATVAKELDVQERAILTRLDDFLRYLSKEAHLYCKGPMANVVEPLYEEFRNGCRALIKDDWAAQRFTSDNLNHLLADEARGSFARLMQRDFSTFNGHALRSVIERAMKSCPENITKFLSRALESHFDQARAGTFKQSNRIQAHSFKIAREFELGIEGHPCSAYSMTQYLASLLPQAHGDLLRLHSLAAIMTQCAQHGGEEALFYRRGSLACISSFPSDAMQRIQHRLARPHDEQPISDGPLNETSSMFYLQRRMHACMTAATQACLAPFFELIDVPLALKALTQESRWDMPQEDLEHEEKMGIDISLELQRQAREFSQIPTAYLVHGDPNSYEIQPGGAASAQDFGKCLQIFIAAGMNPCDLDLLMDARRNRPETLPFLLEMVKCGADLDATDDQGKSLEKLLDGPTGSAWKALLSSQKAYDSAREALMEIEADKGAQHLQHFMAPI